MSSDVYRDFREQVIQALVRGGADRSDVRLMTPPRRELGHLSCNIPFELASRNGKNAREIAHELLDSIDITELDLIGEAVVAGPGYINFYINFDCFGPRTVSAIVEAGDCYGDQTEERRKRIVIEHTSVNPNKPWPIGHSRNAILGDALARLYRKAGYDVEVQNHIDDTGRQVAETIYALERFGEGPPTGGKFDHFAGDQYVRLHRFLEDGEGSPSAVKAANRNIESVLHELEQGLDRAFVERCVDAQLRTAWRLGVFYDLLVWESDIVRANLLEEAMTRIKGSEYVHVASEGYHTRCLVMEMGEFVGHSRGDREEHHVDKVLVRCNGLPTYTAKDIAFQMWKFGLLANEMRYVEHGTESNGSPLWTTSPKGNQRARPAADGVINVIGFEQEYPQTVVRAALKILGCDKQWENSHHLSYGYVWLPEGRMSGRNGTGVSTDEALDLMISEAYRVVKEKRGSELTAEELARIAEAVGVGALRFAMLRKHPESQVLFNWDEVLTFTGYTSLYLQYSYVRTVSILAKAREGVGTHDVSSSPEHRVRLYTADETELIFRLSQLPSVLREAAERNNPSLICQYGYHLAQAFSQFYKTTSVLGAPASLRSARLQLIGSAAIVQQIVMGLLGVPVLDKM